MNSKIAGIEGDSWLKLQLKNEQDAGKVKETSQMVSEKTPPPTSFKLN